MYRKRKKTIVLSGINLFEGGPLSIYYDCLDTVVMSGIYKENRVIAFVHKKELFKKYEKFVMLIELPKSRKNYLYRLYYEYVYFYQISCRHHADIWFSLHDITPKVKADKVFTYCHNPGPFIKKDLTKIKYGWRVTAFSFFYRYLYRINMKSADALIVQQDWMRRQFQKMYPAERVIVARPDMPEGFHFTDRSKENRVPVFVYASFPRYFKNFEVILQACEILEKKGINSFEVWLTINGKENRYSSELRKRYRNLDTVRFTGLLPREKLFHVYEISDYLIFPSKVETWGLPVSEYKGTGKPVILADLPYAHEALGDYEQAVFFDPSDSFRLSSIMEKIIHGKAVFARHKSQEPEAPYADSWHSLLQMLTGG